MVFFRWVLLALRSAQLRVQVLRNDCLLRPFLPAEPHSYLQSPYSRDHSQDTVDTSNFATTISMRHHLLIHSFALFQPFSIRIHTFILLTWQPFPWCYQYIWSSPPQFYMSSFRNLQLRAIQTLFQSISSSYLRFPILATISKTLLMHLTLITTVLLPIFSAERQPPHLYPIIRPQRPLFIQPSFHLSPHPFDFKRYHQQKFSPLQAGGRPNSFFTPKSFSTRTWHHSVLPWHLHKVHHTSYPILLGLPLITYPALLQHLFVELIYYLPTFCYKFSLSITGPCYCLPFVRVLCNPSFLYSGLCAHYSFMWDYVPLFLYAGLCTHYSFMWDYVPIIF